MHKIKFSHWYYKLKVFNDTEGIKKAKLLEAIKIHYNDLNPELIKYDTTYGNGAYPLPKTDLILLIFETVGNVEIFTTIRRYTPNKWVYYKKAEGEIFEVVIDEQNRTD